MSATVERTLKSFGVTPWQLVLGVAALGSWWATVKPLPDKLDKLNDTVQQLSLRVEVHQVLLTSVSELKGEIKELRVQLASIQPKTAAIR